MTGLHERDRSELRTTWARRRYFVQAGVIRPVQGSEVVEYDPFQVDDASPCLYVELASLDDSDDRKIEGFVEAWGLLGVGQSLTTATADVWDHLTESVEDFREAVRRFRQVFELGIPCAVGAVPRGHADLFLAEVDHYMRQVRLSPSYALDSDGQASGWLLQRQFPNLLTAAYALMFVDVAASRNLRICANERCRRPFVTERSDKFYCSARCSDAQTQRELRRREKERPDYQRLRQLALERGISQAAAKRLIDAEEAGK